MEKNPTTRLAGAAFLSMASIYFFSYFQRAAVPGTIFNELQADFGMSASAVATMGSMFTWIYGGMQIFVGLLADRYGGKATLLGGGILMVAGGLLFPMAHAAPLLYGARVLTGLGSSFIYLSIIRELGGLFHARHFTVLVGIMIFIGYCGGITASLPFERAAAAFGWRDSLTVAALLTLAAVVISTLIFRRMGRITAAGQTFTLGPLREVFDNRACRPLLAGSLISFPIFFVIQTVLGKKFLQDFGGLTSPASAAFVMIMTATSAVVAVLGGTLPRYLGHRRKPWLVGSAITLLLATALLLFGVLAGAPGGLFLCGFVLLAVSCASIPAGVSTMKELNRPENVAAAISVYNGLIYVGGGLVAQAGGLILDFFRDSAAVSARGIVYPRAAYLTLFAFLGLLSILNLVFASFIPETNGRDCEPGGDPA